MRLTTLLTLLAVLAAALVAAAPAAAQGEPVDIEADRLIGTRTAEGEVVLLQGNVVLRQGTAVVRSQQGRWVKAQEAIYLTGGVTARDGTLTITAHEAQYHERTDLLVVSGDVRVVDDQLTARSQFGSYDATRRQAELWGQVDATERGRRLQADRVVYLRDRQLAQARGSVAARDSSGELTLIAQAVDFDRAGNVAVAYGAPRLVRSEDDRTVTLTGDSLRLDTERRIAWAVGNVRIERDTLRAEAGRVTYWDDEDRGLLVGDARAWNREVEARGDTIEVFTVSDEVDRASVRGGATIDFLSQEPASAGEQNRLTAPRVEIYFGGDEVDSLYAVGGAENLYEDAPRPERLPERNLVRGSRIVVYFADERLDRAVVTGKPEGSFRFEVPLADSARADEELVSYSGDRIEYLIQDRKIRIQGGVQLSYQGMALTAGRVEFDSRSETLIARDDPKLKDRDEEELAGRTMTYDLESRTGTVYHASTQYDEGYYTGAAIHDAGNNTLYVRDAHYSTCELPEPHYSLGSETMKIQLRKRIVARPIVFYLKKIPLLALPFYILPIEPGRHSGILFPQLQFGFNNRSGRFIRNLGYYLAPNDYMDFTVSGDYYDADPSWVLRGEGRYRVLGRVDGEVRARYTGSQALFGQEQWDLQAHHNQVLGPRTRLTAQGNFTSSRDFTRDPRTGEPLANRLDRFLVSTLALSHSRSWGSMNLFLNRRQDLDTDPTTSPLPRLVEDLPQFSLSIPQRALGRPATANRPGRWPFLSRTFAGYNFRALNHNEVFTTLTGDTTRTTRALQGQLALSDNRRTFAGITLSPRFNSTHVLYEEDALGQRWQPAAVYNLGVGASATYYGTFRPRLGPLNGVRHVLFPQLSYSYQPDFESLIFTDSTGARRTRFPATTGIGISGFRQSFLSYSLQQRFQVKLGEGENSIDLPNLLTITTGGSYDFLWRENGLATPWRPVTTRLRIQPPAFVTIDGAVSHAFDHKPYLRSTSWTASLRLAGGSRSPSPVAEIPLEGNEAQVRETPLATGGPWSLNLTYSFTAGRDRFGDLVPNQSGNAVVSVNPTRNWQLSYYNTVDLDERRIVAQEYSVTRNLHCWQAEFVRRFSAGGESEYRFRIAIRQRPEVYIERGTRGLGSFAGF